MIDAILGGRRWLEVCLDAVPGQVGVARCCAGRFLRGSARADDAVLVVSELVTNAVVHSLSREGGVFVLRVEADRDFAWVECEDGGGVWVRLPGSFGTMHGLDVVGALCGEGGWGVDDLGGGGRVVWARLAHVLAAPDPGRPAGPWQKLADELPGEPDDDARCRVRFPRPERERPPPRGRQLSPRDRGRCRSGTGPCAP